MKSKKYTLGILAITLLMTMLSGCVYSSTTMEFNKDGSGKYYQEVLLKDGVDYKFINEDPIVPTDADFEIFSKTINGVEYTGYRYLMEFTSPDDFIKNYRSELLSIEQQSFIFHESKGFMYDTYWLEFTIVQAYDETMIAEAKEFAGINTEDYSIEQGIVTEFTVTMPGEIINTNSTLKLVDKSTAKWSFEGLSRGLDKQVVSVKSQLPHKFFGLNTGLWILIAVILVILFGIFYFIAFIGKSKLEKKVRKTGDKFLDN